MIPSSEQLTMWRAEARSLAAIWRLPLRNQVWRGMHGQWGGSGSGSSIDFHDHRPYLPGDDPRSIDWKAYARSGHYTMKLYREEVSPGVDLALDVSASMFLNEAKARQSLSLFLFLAAAAEQARGLLRLWLVTGDQSRPLLPEALGAAMHPYLEEALAAAGGAAPVLESVPWRNGTLRLWITDLLYPGPPALMPLAAGKGRGVLLAPYSEAESAPTWDGNCELVDCETGVPRRQRVNAGLRERYIAAYERHFALWREQARRHGIAFAKVAAETALGEALREEALPAGAVEPA